MHGIDISQRFIDLAEADSAPSDEAEPQMRGVRSSLATFERIDARAMTFDGEFDAVICLCQGAFGMMTADGDDDAVVAGMARALRPGGRLALSAFNAYFAVKYHDDAEFDAGHRRLPRSHRDPIRDRRAPYGRPLDGLLHPA